MPDPITAEIEEREERGEDIPEALIEAAHERSEVIDEAREEAGEESAAGVEPALSIITTPKPERREEVKPIALREALIEKGNKEREAKAPAVGALPVITPKAEKPKTNKDVLAAILPAAVVGAAIEPTPVGEIALAAVISGALAYEAYKAGQKVSIPAIVKAGVDKFREVYGRKPTASDVIISDQGKLTTLAKAAIESNALSRIDDLDIIALHPTKQTPIEPIKEAVRATARELARESVPGSEIRTEMERYIATGVKPLRETYPGTTVTIPRESVPAGGGVAEKYVMQAAAAVQEEEDKLRLTVSIIPPVFPKGKYLPAEIAKTTTALVKLDEAVNDAVQSGKITVEQARQYQNARERYLAKKKLYDMVIKSYTSVMIPMNANISKGKLENIISSAFITAAGKIVRLKKGTVSAVRHAQTVANNAAQSVWNNNLQRGIPVADAKRNAATAAKNALRDLIDDLTTTEAKDMVRDLTDDLTQSATQAATQTATRPKAGTGTSTSTASKTATKPLTRSITHPATHPATHPRTADVTKLLETTLDTTDTARRVGKPLKPLTFRLGKPEAPGAEWTLEQTKSALAWKDGFVVHAIKAPYRRGVDEATFSAKKLPAGLKILDIKGKGSQQATARLTHGKLKRSLTVDVGNQDVRITPMRGRRLRVEHFRDTRGTTSQLTIKRHGISKKRGRIYHTRVAGSTIISRRPLGGY